MKTVWQLKAPPQPEWSVMTRGVVAGAAAAVLYFLGNLAVLPPRPNELTMVLAGTLVAGVGGVLFGAFHAKLDSVLKGPLVLTVGLDGIRVRKRFIPWATVQSINVETHVVFVHHDDGTERFLVDDRDALISALNEARRTWEDAPSSPDLPALSRRPGEDDSVYEARLADMELGRSFRDQPLEPEQVIAVASDVGAPREQRKAACTVLCRAPEALSEPVYEALEMMSDDALADELRERLQGRVADG